MTDGNNCYSLKGAVYGVYNSSDKLVQTLETDENGYAKSGGLPQGTYSVKEMSSSPSYKIDVASYDVTVYSDSTSTVNVTEVPQNDPVSVLVGKIDKDTTEAYKQNGATFEGAQFEIKYFDNLNGDSSGTPVRTWVYETNANGEIHPMTQNPVSGDETFKDTFGDVVFPIGTYTIQEIKAPTGYLVNNTIETRIITEEPGSDEHVDTYNQVTTPEQVKRSDLSFSKKFSNTGERGKNIPFLLTSNSTGESHFAT
ncbi:MAG: prealbumin-like fold domain-containing protein [Phoenicibacter congonensis]|uniref:Prealbumin-like fold domain-containing protein n=1 Tax=Phoenicibacter congonensis TaxID=1944646 RepID=A0AA43U9N3_9ACTN|nr:prealbumin-like fold domain-containing protein [Phoenicibacter congonensis]